MKTIEKLQITLALVIASFLMNATSFASGPPPLTIVNIVTPPLNKCFGDCNATAMVVAIGGVKPYTYLWSNLQTTKKAINLCAGTYTVTVTDAVGASVVSGTITVTEPLPIILTTITTNVTCNGVCDGSATATVLSGGTAPFTFLWDDPLSQPTAIAVGLCAGTFTVTVTDDNGCIETATVNLIDPPVIDAAIFLSQNLPSCPCPTEKASCVFPNLSSFRNAIGYQFIATFFNTDPIATNWDWAITDLSTGNKFTQSGPNNVFGVCFPQFAQCYEVTLTLSDAVCIENSSEFVDVVQNCFDSL